MNFSIVGHMLYVLFDNASPKQGICFQDTA